MLFDVGDRVKVVAQFTQSGNVIPVGTCFLITWSGSGSQVACQFDVRDLFLGMHTCSGACDEGRGFWIYKYLLDDNCTHEVPHTPTWIL